MTLDAVNLDAVEQLVRRRLKDGQPDAARAALVELEDFCPETLADMRRAVALFEAAERKGPAEVLIERYLAQCPEDNEAVLDRIFIKAKFGADISKLVETFKPANLEEHMRLADLLKKSNHHQHAARCYKHVVVKDPSNLPARRGNIECLTWSKQYLDVHNALDEFCRQMPDNVNNWAFVALHASLSGYGEKFWAAAPKAEAGLQEGDNYNLYQLLHGYSHIGRRDEVIRLFESFPVTPEATNWMLKQFFRISDREGLWQVRYDVAALLLQQGVEDAEFKAALEKIAAAGRPSDANSGKKLSLWP